MIEWEVWQNDERILSRIYYDKNLTLEGALKQIELYIVNERLNEAGECHMRVRYANQFTVGNHGVKYDV
jgi:hypothetical protein